MSIAGVTSGTTMSIKGVTAGVSLFLCLSLTSFFSNFLFFSSFWSFSTDFRLPAEVEDRALITDVLSATAVSTLVDVGSRIMSSERPVFAIGTADDLLCWSGELCILSVNCFLGLVSQLFCWHLISDGCSLTILTTQSRDIVHLTHKQTMSSTYYTRGSMKKYHGNALTLSNTVYLVGM